MPTYEYVCKDCGEHLEVVQSFKDDALTVCPSCDGELRKVFGSIGIVFKGSGFYKTDSRNGSKAAIAKSDPGAKPEGSKAESPTKSEGGSEPKAPSGGDSGSKAPAPSSGSSTAPASKPSGDAKASSAAAS